MNIPSKNSIYLLPILLILLFAGTASALPVATHGTVQGEMYVSSTANWPSKLSTNNFDVPNGTVVFARYYVGVWGSSGTPTSISTTFNGHEFEAKPSYYSTEMGVTWIPYNVTSYLLPGEKNTATIDTKYWGDGRQYGSTLVVVLKNESKPQMEYWIADGLDWLHYADYLGYAVDNSFTYFNGTVDLANVQSASLYSTHLTGYNYEDFNGKSLSDPTDSPSGDYFNYIRWDNVKPSLVAENQTVNVGRGDDTYCSPAFHALSIVYEKPDLVPVSLTPATVVPNTSNTMTISIENKGNKDSTAFKVSLLVDGTVVDTQPVASLKSGSSTTVEFHWIPDGTKDSYKLTANVDPENVVNEEDETNNSLASLVGTTTAKTPIADFTAKPTSGDVPLTVEFVDTSANSPLSWTWDFGDGTTSNEQNPKHTYNIPGSYNVTLTVTNANGNDSRIKTNYIITNSLVADFTATPLSGGAPLTVTFTDQSTGTPTSWAWDFGDGATSKENNPTHIYSTPGTYTVNLTVTNIGGTNSTVKTGYITVSTITPVANFTATRTTGSSPLTVQFMDQSKNVPAEWFWDFGDGTTSTEQNPTHTYTTIGTYTVKLTATNIAGNNTTTKTGYITVSEIGPVWKAKSEWNIPDIGDLAAPCLADLDGDGDYDLMMGANNGLTYGYENTGTKNNPVWTTKTEWNVIDSPAVRSRPCLTDLDGDGDYDLLIGVYMNVNAYENTGTKNSPVWTRKSAWDISGVAGMSSINYAPCSADLDGDGDYDLLIGTYNGITCAYENTGTVNNPVWTTKTKWDTPDIGVMASPCLADLDGDGDYDLLIGEKSGSYGYENTGTVNNPVWTKKSEWDAPIVGQYMRSCLADLDSDGDYDLLIGTYNGITYGCENTASSAVAKPDLILTSVTPQSSIVTNTPCTISSTINNTGTENANAFNATLSVNNTVVDTQPVSDIASGSSSTVNFTWTPTVAGDYNLTVTADPENGISESDETSNALTVLVTASSGSTAPVANFTADVMNGTAPLTVNFTDQSTGSPTSWFWDFGDSTNATEQNPSHSYTAAGNYTVNLTVSSAAGNNSSQLVDLIKVTESPTPGEQPDLTVSAITPNAGEVFANEANNVSAKVENIGTKASGPFTVTFTATGIDTNVTVDALEAGANATVTIADPTIRAFGDNVTVTATADPENKIAESSEINNQMNITKAVVYNGYKGKRYTGGNDLLTQAVFEGKYGLVYSSGNTAYVSGNWAAKTYTWSSTDLPIPAGSTVESARLYQAYTWNKMATDPAFKMSFNSNTVTPIATYKDRKSYGTYDYPAGLYVYDVTSLFDPAGNSITVTPETGNDYGIYGAYLVVIYKDPAATEKKIWINDEFDLLASKDSYAVSSEEATAYASFSDVNATGISNATAIAVLASGNDKNKSMFAFNDNEYTGFWPDYQTTPQIGFSSYNVTGNLLNGADTARLQSYDTGTGGDSMSAMNVILVADYGETPNETEAPVAVFTATPTSGTAPLTVNFTDQSTGTVSSYAWDFNNDGNVDSTEQNPIYTYAAAGSYTVNLTVIGPGGSDSKVKTGYVKVTGSSPGKPVAAFSASPASGKTPLTVTFTDTSTGSPTKWKWSFGDGTTSTKQNPKHKYSAAGKYTITLTVSNAKGSNTATETDYVKVISKPAANFTSSVTSGKAPLNVKFTDTSTGTASGWVWEFGDGSKSFVQNPTHKYSKAGTYTVNLTVKNAAGRNTVTKTEHIKVTAKPVSNFTSSVTSGKAPLNVKFTDTSTGTPAAWKWSFGDGTSSTHQNPVHKYSKAGTYTVSLTVKNAAGSNMVTKTDYIKVTEKPVAEFSATPTSGKMPLTVAFTDKSTGTPTKWKWNFGDGASSTVQNPKHKYSKAGSYTVTLTATNAAGSNMVTKTDYVKITTYK
ncbi:cell surface protein [Methanosarcina barkeri 3]|uniref:Cell surface protein n=1 Tax=Methanosarcina barkeri 3 TaxID=1434107 RepID=A0A0E3WWA4_METBA|nr:PKD domain-containing protein [Methanosarcina barkeri]AKB81749.1 cell surface protein [Methanosarcina barkeri 3]